jgi:guanylate kinase
MHAEYISVTKESADIINQAKKNGGRIVADGTTSARTLESVADENGIIQPISGETGIFIYPGYKFKAVDTLITNFHLPESTLLMLVSALAGKDRIMSEVLAARPALFNEIISCTTRPMREGEAEGVNYYYLTPEEFAYEVLNGNMLEATCFNDWFYGTPYDSLRSDCYNIGVFNPDGIRAMMGTPDIEPYVFKVVCSDKVRLLRQLYREDNPNVDEIVRRYKTDKEDFFDLEFSYIEVENNDEEDLELATCAILSQLEPTCERGQV